MGWHGAHARLRLQSGAAARLPRRAFEKDAGVLQAARGARFGPLQLERGGAGAGAPLQLRRGEREFHGRVAPAALPLALQAGAACEQCAGQRLPHAGGQRGQGLQPLQGLREAGRLHFGLAFAAGRGGAALQGQFQAGGRERQLALAGLIGQAHLHAAGVQLRIGRVQRERGQLKPACAGLALRAGLPCALGGELAQTQAGHFLRDFLRGRGRGAGGGLGGAGGVSGGGLQIHIEGDGRGGGIGGIRLGRLGRLRAALRRGAGPHVAGQGLRCQRRVQRGGADAFERGVHAPAARGLRAGIHCLICFVFDSGLR